jgi:hypothetical protein
MPYDQYNQCTRPDRDEPRVVCGYPFPCPHHTVVVDVESQTVSVPIGDGSSMVLPADQAGRVGEIAKALRDEDEED